MRIRDLALTLMVLAAAPLRAGDDDVKDLKTDDGRIDPAWYGGSTPDWRRCEGEACADGDVEYDYLWVRPGFSFKGRKIRLAPWEAPAFRGPAKRDADEMEYARKISARAPVDLLKPLNKAFKKTAEFTDAGGDLLLTARVVDCMGPSGFGAFTFSNATLDLKIADSASGEVVLYLHGTIGAGRDLVEDVIENLAELLETLKEPSAAYDMGLTLDQVIERRKKAAKDD